jgi:hypothetical protein
MMKNLFYLLPTDIQREIYCLLEYKDIKKVPTKFYDNENDVYWKLKISTVTDEKTPEGTTHRDFYESFIYEKVIQKYPWDKDLLDKMVGDEIFLTRHINASNKHKIFTALMAASYLSSVKNVKILLDAGADVNYRYQNAGPTALMWAVVPGLINNNEEIIKILLDAGANLDYQDGQGYTALMYAASNHNGSIKNVKILLDAGANTKLKNKAGTTALDLTASEEIHTLLQRSWNLRSKSTNTELPSFPISNE